MTPTQVAPTPGQLHATLHEALVRCNATGFEDDEAVDAAYESLDAWISEYPDQARDIEHLSISASFTATLWDQAGAAARLADPGLVASLIRPKVTAEDRGSATLLALLAAAAHLEMGELRRGQTLLDDAQNWLRDLDAVGPLAPYLVQRCEFLAANFAEAALERTLAAPHYRNALDAGEALVRNRVRLRSLAVHWVPMVYGTGPDLLEGGADQAIELLRTDLLATHLHAALGHARTAHDAEAAAQYAVEACIEFGLPRDASTLELRPVLMALPAEIFDRYFEPLMERAGEAGGEQKVAVWRAMIQLARGRVHARAGDAGALAESHLKAGPDLAAGHDAMTWTGALADMLTTLEPDEGLVHAFFGPYLQIATGSPPALSTPLRLQLAGAVGAATRWAFDELSKLDSPASRRTCSLLLDTLRSPEVDELAHVLGLSEDEGDLPDGLAEASDHALDRLGRIANALTQRPSASAIAMQKAGDDVLFIAATSDEHAPLLLTRAGGGWVQAAQALAEGLADALDDPDLDTKARIEALGRAAFDVLPKDLRELIVRCDRIHLVPDAWADREGIPFELLHDGKDFLGLGKIVARSVSVRDLVRAVEPQVVQRGFKRRALCLAAPGSGSLERLRHAEPEVAEVAALLEESGWDVPDAASARLSPSRLLTATELAGVTHIAAHGIVHAGGEALVLNDGSRLTVEDISERPRLFGGLVYLNACSLGRARSVGGGMTRSLASALVDHGAPCVIANLLPVEDRSAKDLARAFYGAAETMSVGEALRLARRSVAADTPPSRWGTTVLLGDPEFTLAAERQSLEPPGDVTADLLYRYSVPDEHRVEAPLGWLAAQAVLRETPDHPRLQGALKWVQAAGEIGMDAPFEQMEAAARAAHALDCAPGEALFLHLASGAIEDPAVRRRTLDRAIRVLQPLAPLNRIWASMHLEVLAERKKLDARAEIPMDIGPGDLHVNDSDDPATQAVLRIQHAMDQQQLDREGPLRLRLPEVSMSDVAWNAIVVGQQTRFSSEDSQAGYCAQMARKLESLGLIEPEVSDDVRRVLGGMLPFLWGAQRITHLDPDLAHGQANTLRLVVESVIGGWDDEFREVLTTVQGAVEAVADSAPQAANRFTRALEYLRSEGGTTDAVGQLEARIREAIERSAAAWSQARALTAAWSAGTLLERAHQCHRAEPPQEITRSRLLRSYHALSGDMEGWVYPFLMDGFADLREQEYDFVQYWEWDFETDNDDAEDEVES